MGNLLIAQRISGYCDLIDAGYTSEVLDAIYYYFRDKNVDVLNLVSDHVYKDPRQIHEIAQGAIDGLDSDQIRTYSSPKNSASKMHELRLELEKELGLTEIAK